MFDKEQNQQTNLIVMYSTHNENKSSQMLKTQQFWLKPLEEIWRKSWGMMRTFASF